jgi:hypothetical protein
VGHIIDPHVVIFYYALLVVARYVGSLGDVGRKECPAPVDQGEAIAGGYICVLLRKLAVQPFVTCFQCFAAAMH